MTAPSSTVPTISEILGSDALDIFGIIELEIGQQAPSSSSSSVPNNNHQHRLLFFNKIINSKGKLSEATIKSIDRKNRKLSLFFHPDKNPEGRDAFEKLQKDVELLKNVDSMLQRAKEAVGLARKNSDRTSEMSAAEAARKELVDAIAARQELKRQEQQRAAEELMKNLKMMKSGSSSGVENNKSGKSAVNQIFERERRSQMSEVERLEEEMLQEWEVDFDTLKGKEKEILDIMNFLEKRHAGVVQQTHVQNAVRRDRDQY